MHDAVTVHMDATPDHVWSLVSDITNTGDPGRVFEFAVEQRGKALNTWRYEFSTSGDGVDVTESFRLADTVPLKIYWALMGWARGRTNREGMRTTLERVKAVAEAAG